MTGDAAAGETAGEAAGGRGTRANLGILFLTVFIDFVGFSIIFPLFPDMLEYYLPSEGNGGLLGRLMEILSSAAGGTGEEAEFRATVLFGGFLGTLYSTLQFILAPIWGRISDRTGRKPILLLTIGGTAASYLLWFFSGSFLVLVIARCLGGAMAGNVVVASAAVVDSTDEKSRAKGMGMLGAALGLGFLFGPAIGSGLARVDLTEHTGERFGINPFSVAAAGAFLLSVWNLVWVKSRFEETLPEELKGRVRATERTNNPFTLFHRYDHPGINRTNVTYFIFLLAFAGMEFTLTFLAKDRFGYDATNMLWIFLFSGAIIVLVQGGIVRRVAPKYGERNVALAGIVSAALGLVITGVSATQWVFYAGLGLLAAGSGLSIPTLASLISLYTRPEMQGEVQGIFRSLGALSRAVGPIAACAAYFAYGATWLYVGGALLCVVPLVICARLPEPGGGGGGEGAGQEA